MWFLHDARPFLSEGPVLGRDRCDSHGDEVKGEEDLGRAVARLEPARGQRAAGAARHEPAVVGEGGDGEQVVAETRPSCK